uniref:TatD family deoxyribonuclease n=1 Tax=Caldisericum exile TaxID=693075 RepID=A0A7C4U2E5_9BACT
MLIDSHAHIFSQYYSDKEIKEIFNKDILINLIAFDIDSAKESIELSKKYSNAFATIGIHPYDAKDNCNRYLAILESLSKEKKAIAIGEIGLDYYRDITPKNIQFEFFENQILLAKKVNLPFVVHSRMAFFDTVSIIDNVKYFRGIFHSFDYGKEEVKKVLDMGFFVSFSPMLTFKNKNNLREALRYVPLDRLLLETDAPYLTPEPLRGRKNSPEFVRYVYDLAASLLEIEKEALTTKVCENFFNIFERAKETLRKEVACSKS